MTHTGPALRDLRVLLGPTANGKIGLVPHFFLQKCELNTCASYRSRPWGYSTGGGGRKNLVLLELIF